MLHGHKSRNCPGQDNADTPNKKLETSSPETSDIDSANQQQQQNTVDLTQQKEAGADNTIMELDLAVREEGNDNSVVTPDAFTAQAQTPQAQQQTKASDTNLGTLLTGKELVKHLIPDEAMHEALTTTERPEIEESQDGKKLRKQQDNGDVLTARRTRGSRASRYSTDKQQQENQVKEDNTEGQEETTDTAPSTTQQLE
ncbi:hypothetical protein PS15p_210244 [Mucor circinelloides]